MREIFADKSNAYPALIWLGLTLSDAFLETF
jgi:hypothetical protein